MVKMVIRGGNFYYQSEMGLRSINRNANYAPYTFNTDGVRVVLVI